MSHIKKKDMVIVLAGRDRGKKGEVRKVIDKKKVLVSTVNIVVKHAKPGQNKPGGIQKKEAPIDISNVALVCPKCDKPARIGMKILKTEKIRICKKCKAEIV